MNRYTIGYEGQHHIIEGIYLEPEALSWGDDLIPITVDELPLDIVGWARDVQREEDGTLTADFGDMEMPIGWGATIHFNDVVSDKVDGETIIHSARLTKLILYPDLPWRRTA